MDERHYNHCREELGPIGRLGKSEEAYSTSSSGGIKVVEKEAKICLEIPYWRAICQDRAAPSAAYVMRR